MWVVGGWRGLLHQWYSEEKQSTRRRCCCLGGLTSREMAGELPSLRLCDLTVGLLQDEERLQLVPEAQKLSTLQEVAPSLDDLQAVSFIHFSLMLMVYTATFCPCLQKYFVNNIVVCSTVFSLFVNCCAECIKT